MTTKLRTAQLVQAGGLLHQYFQPAYTHAKAEISNVRICPKDNDPVFDFKIAGYGHGIGRAVVVEGDIKAICMKQYTSEAPLFTFTEFYEFRHGNRELNYLLRPLIESKLLPILTNLL